MEQLIPLINKLQDTFYSISINDRIDLPQIAVVGSQSSGKSSVLESLVGRDFLPRGTGIVTRRPLVLQLTNNAKDIKPKEGEEYAEFFHQPGKMYFDFNEVRKEIEAETDRITGSNKGISDKPIHLRVFSPNVVNLTLIDLPGITKVPVGDQPKDIEKQIRNMILQFISRPNCIILAVTAANTDLANSDALKLAKAVDPNGDRTLGVLTKCDLMDPGTDVSDALAGRIYPLKLGFIAVINRGQRDIDNKKPIKKMLEDEAAYFAAQPGYRNLLSKTGTPVLAKTLNTLLIHHIRKCLPEVEAKIRALIAQTQQVLNECGSDFPEGKAGKGGLILQLITQFANNYVDVIDGRSSHLTNQELFGGARINYIFNDKYAPYMQRLDLLAGLTDREIKTAIRNAQGMRSSLFVPEGSFELLVKKQIKLMEPPSLTLADSIYEELLEIVKQSEKFLIRFPELRSRVVQVTVDLLKEYLNRNKQFIQDFIQTECAYINTHHPEFYDHGNQTMALLTDKLNTPEYRALNPSAQLQQQQQQQQQQPQQQPQQPGQPQPPRPTTPGAPGQPQPPQPQRPLPTPPPQQQQFSSAELAAQRENLDADIIRTLLSGYLQIVCQNVTNAVPKSIMRFLVNLSKDELKSELLSKLYKDELFDELLLENKEIVERRKAAQEMLKVLRKAQAVLSSVDDFARQAGAGGMSSSDGMGTSSFRSMGSDF